MRRRGGHSLAFYSVDAHHKCSLDLRRTPEPSETWAWPRRSSPRAIVPYPALVVGVGRRDGRWLFAGVGIYADG